MRDEIRDKRLAELYIEATLTNRQMATRYNLSHERIRQIIVEQIGIDKYKEIKQMRKERTAERIKENYLAGLK